MLDLCPNCGAEIVPYGASKDYSSFEKFCECGYHYLRQGDMVSEIIWEN